MPHRFSRFKRLTARCVRMLAAHFLKGGIASVFCMPMLSASPAAAIGPRDQVIASMFRCAVIGDTRVWLDCFYGAAQPMRVALRLPPVPATQERLVESPPASVQSGDPNPRYQTTSEVLRCNDFSQDRQWLDCYYAAAQPVRAQLGLSPAPQVRPLPATDAQAKPSAVPAPAGLPGATRFPLASRMMSYSFNRYGAFTVVLTNGQAWRQLSGDTSIARWTKPASSYTVKITRGALRSFNLKVGGASDEYKVEQIN